MISSNICYMLIDKQAYVSDKSFQYLIDNVIASDTTNIFYPAIFTSDILRRVLCG